MPTTANVRGNLTELHPARAAPPLGPWQVVRRSFVPGGRSTRSELIGYLFACLMITIPLSFVTGLALNHEAHMLLGNAVTVLLAVPLPTLLIRRYHDSGRSGAWVWLAVLGFTIWLTRAAISTAWGMNARLSFDTWTWLIDWAVIVANLASVMLALLPGTAGANRFGDDPRG